MNKLKALFVVSILCVVGVFIWFFSGGYFMSEKNNFIPREVLFGNPERTMVRVSPDSEYLSFLAPYEGVLNLFIAPADKPYDPKPVTFDKGRGIQFYSWTYLPNFILYGQDTDGDENYIIYLLDLTNMQSTPITPKGVKAFVNAITPEHPEMVIIALNDRDNRYFDLYRHNMVNNTKELLYKNDAQYSDYLIDRNLRLRFAVKNVESGDREIYKILDEQNSEIFDVIPFEDTDTTDLLSLNASGEKLYMRSSINRNTAALYEIDLEKGKTNILGESDIADVSSVMMNPLNDEVDAYGYIYDRSVTVVVNPEIVEDIEYLKKLCDGDLNIISRSFDNNTWVVSYLSDVFPVKYYLYDRKAKSAKYLFSHNSKLEELNLRPMLPKVLKARDGLEMVSYLTLPKGHEGRPAPLVLYVHGGPNARDVWGYNSVHQWLADRGYAVLSVNYRGSTGFGKLFVRAGDGEWAGKMHEDLLDAAQWAIETGITTKEKIAIFGGSYGGYATLVGLTMTPEFFACGVDIVGPSNLKTLYDSIPPYWEPYKKSLQRKFGADPDSDDGHDVIYAKSPINYVDNIVKPILIAQGANDPRVKQAESDQIVEKMKAKGVPYTYLLYSDEGHGFARPENKASFYALAEKFLCECFGMQYEAIEKDLEKSKVKVEKFSGS